MSTGVAGPAPGAPRPGIVDQATAIARIYTRAFLSQGVGLVGLAWCLAADLPWAALGLAVLVLSDQALFLRGRQRLEGAAWLQRGLDAWCLVVSAADLVLLSASLFRFGGLREIGGGPVTDPLSCIAFALAALAHGDLGLAPMAPLGRLLAGTLALLGDLALLGGVVALVRIGRPGPPGIRPR